MILAIDVGNTNIIIGVIDAKKTYFVERITTTIGKPNLEYAVALKSILEIYHIAPDQLDGAIVSSVVPPLNRTILAAIRKITGLNAMLVGSGMKTGLNILMDNPKSVGSDMIVNAVGALAEHEPPIIIIEMGTATTMSVIDKNGRYVGGAILPGLRVSLDSMSASTAQLPRISLDTPRRVIGKNTIDCMRSGVIFGNAAMIDGMLDRIEEELGEKTSIIATGGISYPATGSDGSGYKLARQAGHTIVTPQPSLCSLISPDPACRRMMGLALRNVRLTLLCDGKELFTEQGEALFTHFGLSGPLVLSASTYIEDIAKHRYICEFDLKPALDEKTLYDRLTRDFAEQGAHSVQGALAKLLPNSMRPVAVEKWGVDPATRAAQITKEQKQALVQLCKHWQVPVTALGDKEHAVVTAGGVDVKEVAPKTMASKLCSGLYFAGEVLDVDARTGWYNLQIACLTKVDVLHSVLLLLCCGASRTPPPTNCPEVDAGGDASIAPLHRTVDKKILFIKGDKNDLCSN